MRSEELTNLEINLIRSLVHESSKILDLACGTGRHFIPIARLGYDVEAIEDSQIMIDMLQSKFPTNKVHKADIFEFDFANEKFDLVIMFWNAWNEIVLNEVNARILLEKLKNTLNPNGKILINIDDPEKFDPSKMSFETMVRFESKNYESVWKAEEFDKLTNTTISSEKIFCDDELVAETKITQRWWNKDQLIKLESDVSMKIEFKNIELNEEIYAVLSIPDVNSALVAGSHGMLN